MSKVWVVNYAGHDYTPAKRFGELEWMTEGYISRGNTDRLNYVAAQSVDRTQPDDWLLPSGLMSLNLLVAVFWMERHGSLNLLIHDPKEGEYNPLRLGREQANDLLTVVAEASDGRSQEDHRQAPGG